MKLSIVVAVYNHEKYIKQTILSILDQETTFDYEVLIGEDCSTDNSREILRSIEKKCPANFKFFYRKSNMGSEKNFEDLYSRMQGEYFIVIEGDDYWTEKTKLQQQIEFLDSHKEYIACAHNVYVVDEKSNILDMEYTECKNCEYTIFDYLNFVLPGQTASIMSRNYFLNDQIDKSLLFVPYYAGDRRRAFVMLANGKIYCFQEKWSAYRYVTTSGTSFSATIRDNSSTRIQDIIFSKALLAYSKAHCNKDFQKVSETLYTLSVYGAYRLEIDNISLKTLILTLIHCRYKCFVLRNIIEYKRKKILKKR